MRAIAGVLAAVLAAQPMPAADREVIRADWNRFQEQVSTRRLQNRSVRVGLAGGGEVKTTLLEVNEGGLLVRLTRSARQWKTGEDKALIPKDQVGSVRFSGRVGSHGLIGGLVGLGAGAGIGAAIAMNSECIEGTACLIVLPVVGTAVAAAGGVAGYLIGRRTGQLAPEFVLTRQGGGEGDGTCAQWLEFWQ